MEQERFSYANIANAALIDELYGRWKADPNSVDTSWRQFFEGVEFGAGRSPPAKAVTKAAAGAVAGVVAPADLRVDHLINAYRTYGHLVARFNPIDPHPADDAYPLRLETLGFEESDLDKSFPICGLLSEAEAPLRTIIDTLKEIYCGRIGVEYMGLQDPQMEMWLQAQIEPARFRPNLSIEEKRRILHCLNKSELFEIFLHTKYVGQKRFSLEGGDAVIAILDTLIEDGADHDIQEFVIGMAHRGRLSVLTNILQKPFKNVFHEFEDTPSEVSFLGSGDVKYHKGFSADIVTTHGKKVHLAMAANPSHLESVDPVVQGQVRAKQVLKGDDETRSQIVPILIHGDAAVAGQGVVYETMQLANLPGYGVGGTIHIVINNQIGFTTLPKDARSTRYCTDIARTFSAPVFHVDVEDPEGCAYVAHLAIALRAKFACDVFIDVNCWRKYGHNEADEPAFTQPIEYAMIRKKQSPREIYRDQLIEQGVLEREVAEGLEAEFRQELQAELDAVQTLKTEPEKETVAPVWESIRKANREEGIFVHVETGVPNEKLIALAERFCRVPEGFNAHRKIARLASDRLKMVQDDPGEPTINWGMAEHLAFATLLDEDIHVRLSGQDSRRGTFNHRHAMWMDQKEEGKFFPLNHISDHQGRFDVFNSPLSEYAILGFEFGYSLSYPEALVMWEAQFGDFANGGQIVFDQYLSSSEQKWGRLSGLVLLLPHGYEGQGPEHSSARIERFLQLSGDNNNYVVNPTTPAQMFHVLRRQVLRKSRRPLVIFTPKGLFGHPQCVSSLNALSSGTFEEILDDPHPPEGQPRRLLICHGRVYYDLAKEREERGATDIAIIRVEQLYPLHEERLKELIQRYTPTEDVVWVQEEPSNMGPWDYMRPLLRDVLGGVDATYVGRVRSASPATGSPGKHKRQQAAIMEGVFGRR